MKQRDVVGMTLVCVGFGTRRYGRPVLTEQQVYDFLRDALDAVRSEPDSLVEIRGPRRTAHGKVVGPRTGEPAGNERALVNRIAYYLQSFIDAGALFDEDGSNLEAVVDVEYERAGANSKVILGRKISPDIIVHCRGGANHLAIEVKRVGSVRPGDRGTRNDEPWGPVRADLRKIGWLRHLDRDVNNAATAYDVGVCLEVGAGDSSRCWLVPRDAIVGRYVDRASRATQVPGGPVMEELIGRRYSRLDIADHPI